MRSFLGMVALGALIASSASAAPVVVIVDDKASDDSAYVNGTGGNLSGADALKNAITAINADPGAGPFDVKLIDTDGAAFTYTGGVKLTKADVTIHQVANGNNNDTTITIKAPDASVVGFEVTADAKNFQIAGLSAARRLSFETVDKGKQGLSITNDTTSTLANVNFCGGAGPSLFVAGKGVICESCCFEMTSGWGPHLQNGDPSAKFNNCIFAPAVSNGDFFYILLTSSPVEFNNCTFFMANGPSHYGGDNKIVTYNDCSWFFRGTNPYPFVWYVNGWFGDKMTFNFNRPKFLNTMLGDFPFINGDQQLGKSTTVNVNGASASAKTDLTNARPAGKPFASIINGTINFTDCIIGGWTVPCDGWRMDNALPEADRKLLADKWSSGISFNRCMVTDATFGAISAAWPKRNISATNTIFKMTGAGALFQTWACGGQGTVDMTHCTFVGGKDIYFQSETTDMLNFHYCVFNKTEGKITSCNADAGGTIAGSDNVFFGGAAMNGDTKALKETSTADPKLDATYNPQVNSSCISRAFGSPMKIDFNGATRPLGGHKSATIGAIESGLVPVEMSSFSAE